MSLVEYPVHGNLVFPAKSLLRILIRCIEDEFIFLAVHCVERAQIFELI